MMNSKTLGTIVLAAATMACGWQPAARPEKPPMTGAQVLGLCQQAAEKSMHCDGRRWYQGSTVEATIDGRHIRHRHCDKSHSDGARDGYEAVLVTSDEDVLFYERMFGSTNPTSFLRCTPTEIVAFSSKNSNADELRNLERVISRSTGIPGGLPAGYTMQVGGSAFPGTRQALAGAAPAMQQYIDTLQARAVEKATGPAAPGR